MKRAIGLLPLALVLMLFPSLSGCGGGAASPGPNPPAPNPPSPVTVVISESYVTVGVGEAHQFIATVTGTDNIAVVWRLTGCTGEACGSISSAGYYTAPSHIPAEANVTVKATSEADPSKSAVATVHHMPVAVKVDPGAAWLSPGETHKFTANVDHDTDQLGVTWSIACSDTICGALSEPTLTTVVYTAPSALSGVPIITLKANSVKDPGRLSEAVISVQIASSETLAEGGYAFTFDGWSDSGRVAIAGQFHADGKGQITSGIEDVTVESGSSETLAITGSYEVESDRRGTLILTSSKGTAKYRMSVAESGREGTFISFEEAPMIPGAGSFAKQDASAFSLPGLAGPYAFGLFGADIVSVASGVPGIENRAAIGRFEANSAGVLSGRMDVQCTKTDQGKYSPSFYAENYNLAGNIGAPSADTGRGSITLNLLSAESGTAGNMHFAYYVISAERVLLVGTDSPATKIGDTGPVFSGEVRRQAGPFSVASLAGPGVFSMTTMVQDPWGFTTQDAVVGQLVADGRGSLSGVIDSTGNELDWGYPSVSNEAFTGSYSVDPDGRAVFTKIPAGNADSQIAYLFGQNQAFLMDATADFARFGRIEPQDEGAFNASSISGPLVLAVSRMTAGDTEIVSGWILFDQNGGMSVLVESDSAAWASGFSSRLGMYYVRGEYAVTSNGRSTFKFPDSQVPSAQALVFWVASPSRMVGLANFDSWGPVVMELRK